MLNVLKNLGIDVVFQPKLELKLDVDYLLGGKVCILLNGPMHYFINDTFKLNRKSELKDEILQAFGYYGVNIPIHGVMTVETDTNYVGKFILAIVKQNVPEDVYNSLFKKNK